MQCVETLVATQEQPAGLYIGHFALIHGEHITLHYMREHTSTQVDPINLFHFQIAEHLFPHALDLVDELRPQLGGVVI